MLNVCIGSSRAENNSGTIIRPHDSIHKIKSFTVEQNPRREEVWMLSGFSVKSWIPPPPFSLLWSRLQLESEMLWIIVFAWKITMQRPVVPCLALVGCSIKWENRFVKNCSSWLHGAALPESPSFPLQSVIPPVCLRTSENILLFGLTISSLSLVLGNGASLNGLGFVSNMFFLPAVNATSRAFREQLRTSSQTTGTKFNKIIATRQREKILWCRMVGIQWTLACVYWCTEPENMWWE